MRNLALAVLVGALGLGHPGLSEAQLVLYDDFSSPLIDPDKWYARSLRTSGGTSGQSA